VDTVETFNEMLSPTSNEAEILHTLCSAAEFSQIKVRSGWRLIGGLRFV
jgi:hypothetical protein